MGAFVRNPALARQLIILLCVEALVCGIAFGAVGMVAGLAALGALLVAVMLFCVFSVQRHREIMRLAAEIDEVLHTGRTFDFTDCREGDVAVLRNEVSKMTARLSRTAEQIEHEKSALAEALADVSHQIRTPLTAIELMIPIIERAPSGEERARRLHELENMVDRVSWLVTSLLKMARFDVGAARLQTQSVDAAEIVQAAVEPLAIALDMRGVDCSIDVDTSVRFEGDRAWTTEAVGNIVKNCMEHTPTGGSIAVSVVEDATAVRISVSDTGPGIADEDLPHIFERFYRGSVGVVSGGGAVAAEQGLIPEGASAEQGCFAEGEMSLKGGKAALGGARKHQGFGIGLALAQSYISAQGGTLRVRNQVGGGARFEITFPKITV